MTRTVAPTIVRCGVVSSTQTVAFALAADGAPDRTVVVADSQSAGRGRRGRTWHDEPGASLLLSVLLRSRLPLATLPTLSLTAAVAVAEALERVAGLTPRLKWPNDVLAGSRKIAGILLESRLAVTNAATRTYSTPPAVNAGHVDPATNAATRTYSTPPAVNAGHADPATNAATRTYSTPPAVNAGHADPATMLVIVGIGVNLKQRAFPPDLQGRATSVLLETGQVVDRETALDAVLATLDHWRTRLETDGFAPIREGWIARTDTLGRHVSLGEVSGVAVDLGLDGALIVREGDRLHRIVSGDGLDDAPGD